MALYALTTIHGPGGPRDIAQYGEELPDWPDWFLADLTSVDGIVSTDQPAPRGVARPPHDISLTGEAVRMRADLPSTGGNVHLPPDWRHHPGQDSVNQIRPSAEAGGLE